MFKDLVPCPHHLLFQLLRPAVLVHTQNCTVICPARFSRLLADGFFPGAVILWSLNSLCGDWYPLGYRRKCLWHGQQLAGLFREYFQSLCQWGRSRRRNREGEVEWWRHPYAPCSCRRSQFSVVLNLGEFSQASVRGTSAHSLLSNSEYKLLHVLCDC